MRKRPAFAALFMAPVALWLLWGKASSARADGLAPTVVLLRPTTSDAVTAEAMARVDGELKAAGFDVAVIALNSDDAKRDIETAGRALNPIAAFAIFVRPPEGGTSVAEIWMSDRIRQKTVIENALLHETDRGRGAAILAVRAVELLKANLADFWSPAGPAPLAKAAPPTPPARPSLPASETGRALRRPFAAGLGAGLAAGFFDDFRAEGLAWAPEATVSYGWPSGFSVRASWLGLMQVVTFSTGDGSAEVSQQFGMAEAVKTWWPLAAVVPFVCAGIGAQSVHVKGTGTPPNRGNTSDNWSLVTAVGVGVSIPVVSFVSFRAQARGLTAWPSGTIQIANGNVGTVGTPSLFVDAGVFAALP